MSLILIAGVVYFISYDLIIAPKAPSTNPVEIVIKSGMNTTQIAELLNEKKVIRNPYFFLFSAKINNQGTNLKAGAYEMHENMDYDDALALLEKGPARKVFKIVIPEGLRVDQVAEKIAVQSNLDQDILNSIITSGGVSEDEMFVKAPWPTYEGFLFPKTYEVFEDSQADDLIKRMLDQFLKETKSVDWRLSQSWGLTKYDIIIIASLIEREAMLDEERPKVAAVIFNRLQKGMPLQIDATVQYALGGNNPKLTTDDLKVESVYNTYINLGLPPGPICSPGLESIKAALSPAEVDFLYYVLTGKDGSHTFTNSYEEFLAAKVSAKNSLK